jgi:hypothetical protein
MKEEPLEGDLYYGIEDRSYLYRDPVQPELLPEKLNQLRWKLNLWPTGLDAVAPGRFSSTANPVSPWRR